MPELLVFERDQSGVIDLFKQFEQFRNRQIPLARNGGDELAVRIESAVLHVDIDHMPGQQLPAIPESFAGKTEV